MMNARLAGRIEREHQAKVDAAKRAGRMNEGGILMKGIYERTVSRNLLVTFKGYEYDASAVAGASVGATLRVCFFAEEWPRAIRVFQAGMHGDVRLMRCPRIERDVVVLGESAPARVKGKAERRLMESEREQRRAWLAARAEEGSQP